MCPFKQNEENKKKNKRAALKAQMDLEEARNAASHVAEQQKNNNASIQDQEGERNFGILSLDKTNKQKNPM